VDDEYTPTPSVYSTPTPSVFVETIFTEEEILSMANESNTVFYENLNPAPIDVKEQLEITDNYFLEIINALFDLAGCQIKSRLTFSRIMQAGVLVELNNGQSTSVPFFILLLNAASKNRVNRDTDNILREFESALMFVCFGVYLDFTYNSTTKQITFKNRLDTSFFNYLPDRDTITFYEFEECLNKYWLDISGEPFYKLNKSSYLSNDYPVCRI
jgi:hypothetical protein